MKKIGIILIILIISLALCAGCTSNENSPAAIYIDVDGDNFTDFVYLEVDETTSGKDDYYNWNLKKIKSYGKENLSQTAITTIMSFETKPENLRIEDYDGDGINDILFFLIDRGRTGEDSYYDWDLMVARGSTNNLEKYLSSPIAIMSFETKPENLRIEDYDGDGINDILFFLIDRGRTGEDSYYDWDLMVARGDGTGSLLKPTIIASFERRPGTP